MAETSETHAESFDPVYAGENEYATMYNMIFAYNISQVVRCAAMFSLADHLSKGPATAEQVARAEGLDPEATFRLMRACVSFGLMTCDENKRFSGKAPLNTLRKGDPRSLRDVAAAIGGHGHWAPWGKLDVAIRTGHSQAKAALGSSIWDYYATPAGAEEGKAFTQMVAGLSTAVVEEAGKLIDTGTVSFAVDVGGASGSLIHALMKANPTLRGTVLDLPHVESDAAQAAAALGLQERLSFTAGDFFEGVPAADLYLIKHILHDWPDDASLSVLRNCRRAANPGARVVVIEALVDDNAPTPLLSYMDLTMFTVVGARERTLDEYKIMLEAGGFQFTQVTPTATPFSLIEAVAI